MAEQVLVQARVDKELKQEVSEIYNALGMDLPTAIRMFLVTQTSHIENGKGSLKNQYFSSQNSFQAAL